MAKTQKDLLSDLANARTLTGATEVVADLEAKFNYQWRAVGDREGNYGLINIGSDPGYALIERVTNAVDAVIECEAAKHLKKKPSRTMPASPREAVEEWFAIAGGRIASLPIKRRQEIAEKVIVRLLPGASRRQPTVEIRDFGIGLTPTQIPKTILSLGESNKVDKAYLAGAYGQGGSTAMAFSPKGTLFVSRRQPTLLAGTETDRVGVTFARYNELDPRRNKNGRFEYLVTAKNEVPEIDAKALDFDPGTAVLHFDLDIPQYAARLTQLTGSLWWLLQNTLFDPVLPFWAEERRPDMLEGSKKDADRRTIAGNFTRLSDDKKDKVEHHDSISVNVGHQTGVTNVKINYWVLRQAEDSPSAQPIESYVDPYRPVAYTFHGQTHGTDDRRFVAERLALPYLAKFLIMQVELDHLTPHARRELLSTTRDRLKQLSFYSAMRESISSALAEDEELIRLNDQRKERILAHHSEAERVKMRERFAKLMERFKAGVDATAAGKGGSAPGRKPAQSGNRQALTSLPTRDEPTFIKIANTQKPVQIRIDRHALLRLESDAPDGYLSSHIHAKLTLTCEPEGLVTLESKSDFRGGRARVTVKPTDKVKAGDSGSLTIFLFTPDEKALKSSITFRAEKPEDEPSAGSGAKSKVQVPEPIPVYRANWNDHGWTDISVADVKEDGKDTKIFVNIDNVHITRLLQSGGYQETGVKRMRNSYLLYVAFFAWAQHVSSRDMPLEGKEFEDYKSREMDRAAQTVVHSISATGRMEDEE